MKFGYTAKIPFSPCEAQEEGLKAAGVDRIYVEGRGAENLAECFKSMRADKELHVFGGLRVFAGSRDSLVLAIKDFKKRKIVVVDDMNSERLDTHEAEMLVRALRQILGSNKVKGSRKFAREIAKRGGKAKGESMAKRRDGIADKSVIVNVVNCPLLTWEWKVKIFDGKISEATMRRRYYWGK